MVVRGNNDGDKISLRFLFHLEYQNYLIAKDCKSDKVKKQISDIKKPTREEARKPRLLKTIFSTLYNLITQYNPFLFNLKTIIIKHLPIWYSNQQILDILPHNTISAIYKKNKNLREILSPSLSPTTTKQNECYIKECNKKCDICKNVLVFSPWCCGKQYVGSATGFKERFRIHKSHINTGKISCGVANHLLNVSCSSASKFE